MILALLDTDDFWRPPTKISGYPFFDARERSQSQYPCFHALPGIERMVGFSRRDRAPGDPEWWQLLAIAVSAWLISCRDLSDREERTAQLWQARPNEICFFLPAPAG
jgi:hypothetical protein